MKVLRYLFSVLSRSHLKEERLTVLLTWCGVVLGVTIFVAIRSANDAAFSSFAASTAAIGGEATLSLSTPGGVQESLITSLRDLPGVRKVHPVSIRHVRELTTGEVIELVGLDLFADTPPTFFSGEALSLPREKSLLLFQPGYRTLVSSELKRQLKGSPLRIARSSEPVEIEVLGTLPPRGLATAFAGRVAVVDIASFQEFFQSYGFVDQLSLELDEGMDLESVADTVKAALPSGTVLNSNAERVEQGARMTEAFRVTLTFLALIALFAAFLLVYNTVSFSILRRRREFGILLALGSSPRLLFRLILLEVVALSFTASLVGVSIGFLLARSIVGLVTRSMSALYVPVSATEVPFSWIIAGEALCLGPVVAVLAALIPAAELYSVPPRETFSYQTFEERFRKLLPLVTKGGALLLCFSALTAQPKLLSFSVILGFLPPTLAVVGVSLLIPRLLLLLIAAARRFANSPRALLAADHLSRTLKRNAVACAAVAISLGMFLGVTTMIASFRGTVERWISHITTADIYISAQNVTFGESGAALPENLERIAATVPGVKLVDWVSSIKLPFRGRDVQLSGLNFPVLKETRRLLFKENPQASAWSRLEGAFVSESFSTRFALGVDDSFSILWKGRTHLLQVTGVFYDYASDQGVIYVPLQKFSEITESQALTGVSLYLHPQSNSSAVISTLRQSYPNAAFLARDNKSLRQEVLTVFDQTFQITYTLQIIALIVSTLTVLNTIVMLIYDRKREFMILRAIGASASDLRGLVTWESGILGATGAIGAICLGLILQILLVFVINRHFFAWSIEFKLSLGTMLLTATAAFLLALIAGAIPGIRLQRQLDASLIRYE